MDGVTVLHLFLLLVALMLVLKTGLFFISWILSCVCAGRLVDVLHGTRRRESRCEAAPALSSHRPFDADDISTDLFEHHRLFGEE